MQAFVQPHPDEPERSQGDWTVELWKGPELRLQRYIFTGKNAENRARSFWTGYNAAIGDLFLYETPAEKAQTERDEKRQDYADWLALQEAKTEHQKD